LTLYGSFKINDSKGEFAIYYYAVYKEIKFKFVKFAGLGLFVFAWGILFNILQVELLQISKQTAYTPVVVSQIFLGFFLNRYFVFKGRHKKVIGVFLGYLAVLTFFRAVDWLLYFVAVQWLSVPYILSQIINNLIIFFAKFVSYRPIFESKHLNT
jgi:putative flippase GtrA